MMSASPNHSGSDRQSEAAGSGASAGDDGGRQADGNEGEREGLLGSLFNTRAMAIAVLDTDGHIVRANARAEELLRLSPSAIEGRPYDAPQWAYETLDGAPLPEEKRPFRRVMAADAPVHDLEHAIRGPDGRRRLLSVDGEPLRDEEGTMVEVVLMIDDVTERKRRERALRDECERFEAFFDTLPTPVVRGTIEEGRLVVSTVNTAFEEVFGVEEEAVRGTDPNELIVPDSKREEAAEIDRRAVEDGPLRAEVRRETTDGLRDFQVQVAGRTSDDGSEELHAIYIDVTDRKEYEQEMAYRAELERMIVGISTRFISAPIENLDREVEAALGEVGGFVDADRSYVFLVDAEAQTTSNTHEWCDDGISSHQPMLQNIPYSAMPWFMEKMHGDEPLVTPWVPDLPDAASALRKILEDGNIQSLVVLPMTQGDALVGFIGFDAVREQRDWDPETVTILRVLGDAIASALNRKEMEASLRAAKEEAEEASVLKSAMLANMSHEIRTPLTSIVGLSEVLQENLEGDPADLADIVYKSSQRLKETLTSVLQLSKLEAGAHELERESVDLAPVADETVKLLHPKAVEQSVEIDARVPDEPVTGEWDEGALKRIVTNLAENAIKFTPEGGEVVVRVRADEAEAVLEVEDTGVGIDEDFLSNIFNAFEQEEGGMAREHEGSGLGLAITKRLTEALGGTIDVESEKGDGTCFLVRLPRTDDGTPDD